MKNSVTIVFDGRPEFYGRVPSSVARVVFSEYESADDKIKKIVTEARNRKNITVVTDDRDIQYAVRALGAKASSVKAFLSRGKASTKKKGSGEPAKYISKVDETKITSEMQKIWLKPNG